jgi:hypothetical protein
MGALVMRGILRFRRWRGGAGALLLVIPVTVGLTVSFGAGDGTVGMRNDPQAPRTRLAEPMPAAQEMASSRPEPTASPQGPAAESPRPEPPAPRSPAVTRERTSVTVPARPPAGRPDIHPLVASSTPLGASPPTRVDIGAVGITAPVGPLGLNPDGSLEVPSDFARAGWYTGRPTPGEAGPAVIVAHRSSRRGPGAFWKLPGVQPGEQIVVTRADGKRVLFVVDRVEQHRKDAFPTEAVYGPTSETALRVITCGGPFEPALGDRYRDNIIVFARMTGWA